MSYHDLLAALGTTEDRMAALLRKHQFMLLPYEPNVADIEILQRATCRTPISAVQLYEAMVDRRRTEPEVHSGTPSRVDKDIG